MVIDVARYFEVLAKNLFGQGTFIWRIDMYI